MQGRYEELVRIDEAVSAGATSTTLKQRALEAVAEELNLWSWRERSMPLPDSFRLFLTERWDPEQPEPSIRERARGVLRLGRPGRADGQTRERRRARLTRSRSVSIGTRCSPGSFVKS